jgi:hypothetical protein
MGGKNAHLLVGARSLQPLARPSGAGPGPGQSLAGLDVVTRKLGGLTRKWRFDRMTPVLLPNAKPHFMSRK